MHAQWNSHDAIQLHDLPDYEVGNVCVTNLRVEIIGDPIFCKQMCLLFTSQVHN